MALLFSVSIDCSKITKSKLEKGKYLKVTGRISDEPSQFNTNVSLYEEISKEHKEAGIKANYIANGRVVWKDEGEIPVVSFNHSQEALAKDHKEEAKATKRVATTDHQPFEEETEDLPF